jgi:hypothetical protein
MTQDEIMKMARRAGFDPHDMSSDFTCNLKDINSFAKLVAQHEREKFCAVLRQLHDSYSLASDSNAIQAKGQA